MRIFEIRSRFIDFFAHRDRTVVPSASLLYNDSTLLLVNAGMVSFRPHFMGKEPAPHRRAASIQKCIRTLDIDDMDRTTRHGTFFQMVGDFAFGDYFREDAINYTRKPITTEILSDGPGFRPDQVWVTVLHGDEETVSLWRKTGVPRCRIQECSFRDNYWRTGVPGPGGPCSKIYIDRGPELDPDGGPGADKDRFLETWNLVFQQKRIINVTAKDKFDVIKPLATQNISTGSGLERIACLRQGIANMYETGETYPVIAGVAELSGRTYGTDPNDDIRFRMVADHMRSLLVLMTDGVTPDSEAHGYVLRRLLHRSIRAMRLLDADAPVLGELLPISRDAMSVSYPKVNGSWARISEVSEHEEVSFRRTLSAGTQIFDLAMGYVKQTGAEELPGGEAFQLHDTYGFLTDLTLEMATGAGLGMDRAHFTELMRQQKEQARADAKTKKGVGASSEAYKKLHEDHETLFVECRELEHETKIIGIVSGGQVVTSAINGQIVELMLAEAPFYTESGGQDTDTGRITGDGRSADVLDAQRLVPDLIVHRVQLLGDFGEGAAACAAADPATRHTTSQAHTATHVIHAALRELVGQAATQADSYNRPGYLYFNCSATHGMSEALQLGVEQRANQAIRDSSDITASQMKLKEAKALGAIAMFGEEYPSVVRVMEFADPWSRELCGSTHVANTAQVGVLNLLSGSSVGSGVRRVEVLAAQDTFGRFAAERALVATLTDDLRVQPEQLAERVDKLLGQLKSVERQIAALQAEKLLARSGELAAAARKVGDVRLVAGLLPGIAGDDLRTLALDIRERLGAEPTVVALFGSGSGKAAGVAATNAATRDLGVRAGQLISVACRATGGKDGGKGDLAQGGGSGPAAVPKAITTVEEMLAGRG